jgi:hypothetical protein
MFVGLTIGIVIWIIMPVNNISLSTGTEQEETTTSNRDTTSFHMNMSGKKFWFSIKITCLTPTNMTLQCIRYSSFSNKTMEYFSDSISGKDYCSYRIINSGYCFSDVDYYYQVHLKNINLSYYHTTPEPSQWGGEIRTTYTYKPDTTGTHYFTYFSYADDCDACTVDIWINASTNISISTTQGQSVFLYTREDFLGTLNLGWKRGTIILNGEKEITVNNTFCASFFPLLEPRLTGFEFLEYQMPSGDRKHRTQIDIHGEPYILNYTRYFDEKFEFDTNLWLAEKGNWTFKTTMMKIGLWKEYPTIILFGADIMLPD